MRHQGGKLRPDVLEYCRSALDILPTMPRKKIQAIGFEIAILGQNKLGINNRAKKYELKELPGEFTGLNLCASMYVATQQIAPGTNVGINLSREYKAAVALRGQ